MTGKPSTTAARRMPVRHVPRRSARLLTAAAVLVLAGCGGMQSALDPGGDEADMIAQLFWLMAIAAAAIWLAVIGIALYAMHARPRAHDPRLARRLIVAGGVIVPVVVLAALLVHGLSLMPKLRPPLPDDALRIAVSGEQWWWRVHYHLPDGGSIALANEIRLPVGERVAFELTSPDVIHSFWIPALGGKVDMTPGRTTTLVATPREPGSYRGACAEYCGASHAHMNLYAVVMPQEQFARWLEHQRRDAQPPQDAKTRRGARAFIANGCGACHAIRGTAADGTVGPDLTHLASRLSLAAGTLPNTATALRRWIAHTREVKPGAHMPPFHMLDQAELDAIIAYLAELE